MITLTLTPDGMQLARPGARCPIIVSDPTALARAITLLATPTQPPTLGQRLARARAKYLREAH